MTEEEKVSIYDPIVDAYREVPISQAERFIKKHEETKSRVENAKVEAEVENEIKEV